MILISVRFDSLELERRLRKSVNYSNGFLEGVQMEKITFMRFLGGFVAEALGKYIDSRARANPSRLHHVYEPGSVGNQGARLFKFNVVASASRIMFNGSFLPSKGIPLNGGDPFIDKANIMENAISITIAPKNAQVLAFPTDDGEMAFTSESVFIAHPGGDGVAGSFGETVDQFFSQYLTNALLRPLFNDLQTAEEYVRGFGGDRSVGVRQGRRYLSVSGLDME